MGFFSRLPLDLILLILHDLTPHDILSLRLVNRAYYQLFTSDLICQEGLKLFFADCWEYQGKCTEAIKGESGRLDVDHNLRRGRELFDKVYLRRERFRTCRPTSFSSIDSRWSDKSNSKLCQSDGLLFILQPGGGPLAIELYDLYHPKYNDNGKLVRNAVVPLFEAGNDSTCDRGFEEDEDELRDSEYVGSALVATKSQLVELKRSSHARGPLPPHRGARATRGGRGKRPRTMNSDIPNISAAFDLTSTNPFAAAQDGVLLFTARFHEQHWTPRNEHGLFELGRMCPTAFIAISTVRGEAFAKVIQAWTSPNQLYIPSSDDRDNPTVAVNRRVAVWRENYVGVPPSNVSREKLQLLPLGRCRGESPITSTKGVKPRRLNQKDYEQSVASVMVDIPFSEMPSSNTGRAIAVGRDAEMMFYAAGGRNAGVLVFVFGIYWDAYGSRVTDLTKLRMIKLDGIGILKEMERAEGPWWIDVSILKLSNNLVPGSLCTGKAMVSGAPNDC
ncbi:hypothetical protein EV426DRAFT_702720 [Tirmania nivea]|nr:hypothetical protein EV426DRAFT_702720 [Tirmania nivea]